MNKISNVEETEQFLYNIGLDMDLVFGEYYFDVSKTNSGKDIVLYNANDGDLLEKLKERFKEQWGAKFIKAVVISLPSNHEFDYQYYLHFSTDGNS